MTFQSSTVRYAFIQALLLSLFLSILAGIANANLLELVIPSVLVKKQTAVERSWRTPQLIETNAGDAGGAQIAFDSTGNGLAVWVQSDGIRTNIWANRYVLDTGWGTAQLIETDDAGDASQPQVAAESVGNFLVIWTQSDGSFYHLWSRRYESKTGWTDVQPVETSNGYTSARPQIALNAAGDGIAVWQQYDGTRTNIWANQYSAESGWGVAQIIETDNIGGASYPQVAIDVAGNGLAVWNQYDGTRYNIWANRYVAGSGWGIAQLIETDNAGYAQYPQVAMDADGNGIAVWQQNAGTYTSIYASRYVAGAGWENPQLIENDNVNSAYYPNVAIDSAGNAIVVWRSGHSYGADSSWANRYAAGIGWGTAQLISEDASGVWDVQVAVDSSGNAMAVWYQTDDSRDNIWANRYVAGSGWQAAQLIELDDVSGASYPQVAFDSVGRAIAVWQQYDDTYRNIWAVRYE